MCEHRRPASEKREGQRVQDTDGSPGRSRSRRQRSVTQLIGAAAVLGFFVCALPRDGYPYGWPLTCVDAEPVHLAGRYSPNEAAAVIEEMWNSGQIGPRDDWRFGWFLMKPVGRTVLAVSPYRAGANIGAACTAWFAVACGYRLWRQRRDPRLLPGHCDSCGYDLTGNTSGRCPECGTAVKDH